MGEKKKKIDDKGKNQEPDKALHFKLQEGSALRYLEGKKKRRSCRRVGEQGRLGL